MLVVLVFYISGERTLSWVLLVLVLVLGRVPTELWGNLLQWAVTVALAIWIKAVLIRRRLLR